MIEGTVFPGISISGPPDLPDGTPEGTVFTGLSVTVAGDGTTTGGLGNGTLPAQHTPTGTVAPHNPVTVNGPLQLNASANPQQAQGMPYFQIDAASGGIPPYTYSLAAGSLPLGTTFQTNNGASGNVAIVSGQPLNPGPFSYTIEAQDSSGQISVECLGGGPSQSGPEIITSAPNQLVMIVIVSSRNNVGPDVNQVTGINASGLTFTRVFHDESFTYSDAVLSPSFPVVSVSVDIFTAPAAEQVNFTGWTPVVEGDGFVNEAANYVLVIGGLKDINSPFDPNSLLPNVASNATGSPSDPVNIVTTTNPDVTLFGVMINHTPGESSDTTPIPALGWNAVTGSPFDSGGGSAAGFASLVSYHTVSPPAVQNDTLVPAGFEDDFWYSVVFAFVGGGGTPATATVTVSGTISGVVPGSQTFVTNNIQPSGVSYFNVPPYNTLTIEIFGGSETGSEVISTFGAITSAPADGFNSVTYTPTTPGAPPIGGVVVYEVGTGSPAGEIIFTWS
jgi:hypothetical protein